MSPCALVIAWAFRQINRWDLRSANQFPLIFRHSKYSPNRRNHFIALRRYLFLEILRVIDSYYLEIMLLIDSKYDNPTTVLI